MSNQPENRGDVAETAPVKGDTVHESEVVDVTANQALLDLHPRTQEGPNRDTVLLVEEDDAARRMLARVLSGQLPDFCVSGFASPQGALTSLNQVPAAKEVADSDASDNDLALALQGTSSQVALVIANIGHSNVGVDFAQSVWVLAKTDTGLQKVPFILTTGWLFEENPNLSSQVGSLVQEGSVNAVLYKPFRPPDLELAIVHAAHKRAGVFTEIQKRALSESVQNYTTYYPRLLGKWKASLTPFTDADDDVRSVLKSTDGSLALLADLAKPEGLEESVGRRIFHDLNNCLNTILGLLSVFAEDGGALGEASNNLIPTVTQFIEDTKRIQAIYQGRALATDFKPANQGEKIKIQKLTGVEGLGFFIVDDNRGVIGRSMADIGRAGASSFAVDTPYSLSETLEGETRPNVDVILLDHQFVPGENPGDAPNVPGYTLIDSLRQVYPDVLIVAHTADAEILNADPNNPYKAAGVEIIEKGEWNALSGIVRKWRLAKAEVSQKSETE